jgi:purine nucleosidase
MPRKVIIDCDMAADDVVALSTLLFDPRLDVVALTACEGTVTAEQATANAQLLVELLDPKRYPRLGAASPAEHAPAINTTFLYGQDGLGNLGLKVSRLQHFHPAEKLIIDCVRANPGDITIVCLGPLTNIARAFRRDPQIPELTSRLIITGGTLCGIGNVTQSADFNFYFDPTSANEVVQSRTTKTLIPLDVTSQIEFGLDLLDELPDDDTRIGSLLRRVLPFAFRAYRQQLGQEHITLNDAIGALAVLEPELFAFEEMAGQVETAGLLTRGMIVFDRRARPEWTANMEVATSINAEGFRQHLVDLLQLASRRA